MMEFFDNEKKLVIIFSVLFSLLVLFLFFFPIGLYFLSLVFLGFIANVRRCRVTNIIFYTLLFFLVISVVINELSVQRFLSQYDDFTSYYNNYLDTLHGNYSALFEFGNGLEIGLPIINLLFSYVIGEPYPYILQLLYIIIFIIMLYIAVRDDNIFSSANASNKYMLFLWAVLFVKLTAMLTIERQAIASFFVIYAILNPRKKLVWVLVGSLFHLSTPIVYFIVRYILTVRTWRKVYVAAFVLIAGVSCAFTLLSIVNVIFPNDKVGYVLYFLHNKDYVKSEIIKSFKQVMYIIPLLLLDLFLRFNNKKWYLGPSLWLLAISTMILSFLPGVPTRLVMPIFFILIGFYYHSFFSCFNFKVGLIAFILVSLLMFFYKLVLPGYYYRYPMLDFTPGYYLPYFVEESGYIQRSGLSESDDVIIENKNKL